MLAGALAPELGIAAGTLGFTGLEAGLGAGLGAGSGALFSEITGGSPGSGALSGAIGGAAGPIGGAAGEALGIGETAGTVIGGAAGGAAGAGITGSNPLIGAAEGAAAPAVNAVAGISSPSTTITPTAPSTGAGSAAGAAGSAGAGSAAIGSSIPLDPTSGGGAGISGGGAGPPGSALGGTSGGGAGVDGANAMGLSDPNAFMLPTGTTSGPDGTFSATGFTPLTGVGVSSGGTIDASGGGGLGADIMGLIQKNPGALLSGGLLATQLFRGNEQYPAEKSLQTLATNTGTQGAALSNYINSGTLPPGAKQAVDQATNAAKATLRSRFAEAGMSGSTPEAQALSEVDTRAAAQTFQMADQLLAQGADFTKISGTLYDELLKTQASTDQEFQKALMTFAGGLGGLRGGGGA